MKMNIQFYCLFISLKINKTYFSIALGVEVLLGTIKFYRFDYYKNVYSLHVTTMFNFKHQKMYNYKNSQYFFFFLNYSSNKLYV